MIGPTEGRRLPVTVPGVGPVVAEVGKGGRIVWLTHRDEGRVLSEWEGDQAMREVTYQYPSLHGLKFRW